MSLSVLSLFAGIGGIDLGLERTGKFQTVAYSEIDDYACTIMQRHFPNAVNIGDMTQIDWTTVQPVDVIVGGFPCQDISTAGKGAGIHGSRSGLWANLADAIRALRPRGVIVENVAALLHRGIDRVLGDLAACGYDAEWDCIPAAAVGAPHLRNRVFIIAYPVGIGFSRSWKRPQPVDSTQDAYREAADVVDAFRRRNLPFVCRRHDGFSFGMDRLRCLGNAVVPQVAEHVGRILLDRIGEA